MGRRIQGVWNNHDFRPISRSISEMMQDRAIVTMEDEWEIPPKLSNGTRLNDLQWHRFQGHDYSTSNNSKIGQHSAISLLTMADQ